MPTDAPPRKPDCTLLFEGTEVPAVRGEPIAVALVAAGTRVLSRSIKYHRPRSFFCLAGHCGACLMRIDGEPNVKACRAPASDGISVERQNAFPSASFDMLGAADLFFPRGMDHHTLMTSSRALNAVMRKVVREVGGLGRLPDEKWAQSGSSANQDKAQRRHVDVAIIGGGPAGLSAALACARRLNTAGKPRPIVVVDEDSRPGGSLLSHPQYGISAADQLVSDALAAGVEIRSSAAAFGYYPEDEGGILAVDDRRSLLKLSAERYVYATGGYDTNALFADNDRPGICAARAVGTLLVRHGVVAARRVVVLGNGAYAEALAIALTKAGCTVRHIDGISTRVVGASGKAWVRALVVQRAGGSPATEKIPCDLVAVASLPSPASELARQHGVEVKFHPEGGGFACTVDEDSFVAVQQTLPIRSPIESRIHACGDVCGFRGVEASLEHGRRAGVAVADSLLSSPHLSSLKGS